MENAKEWSLDKKPLMGKFIFCAMKVPTDYYLNMTCGVLLFCSLLIYWKMYLPNQKINFSGSVTHNRQYHGTFALQNHIVQWQILMFKVSVKISKYFLEIAQSLIYRHQNETIGLLLVSILTTRITAKLLNWDYKNFDLHT